MYFKAKENNEYQIESFYNFTTLNFRISLQEGRQTSNWSFNPIKWNKINQSITLEAPESEVLILAFVPP